MGAPGVELARPRRGRALLALLGAAVLALAVGGWIAVGASPEWWNRSPQWSATPEATEQSLDVARGLEQGVASEVTRVRGPGVQAWRVRLRCSDVNAWFAVRLPQWIEHDRSLKWPDGVGTPQMHVADDRVIVGAPHGGRIASTRWRIDSGAAGQAATLVPDGARLGVVPVPFANTVGGWFLPELAGSLRLEVHLGDGRTVRVVGAECGDDEVILDCETAAPLGG